MSSLPESALQESPRRLLLNLARRAISSAVINNRLPDDIPEDGMWAEPRGVFVTLNCKGKLRGCIGVVEGHQPLGHGIVHAAVSAALQDYRFARITPEELPELSIEVSILSPMIPLRPDEVLVGKHGLLVVSGRNRGLLLPQVAVKHGFTREQFLQETCMKAGLPRDAWKDPDVLLFGFTCEVHSESPDL